MRKIDVYTTEMAADVEKLLFNAGLSEALEMLKEKAEDFQKWTMRDGSSLGHLLQRAESFGELDTLAGMSYDCLWRRLVPEIFAYVLGDTPEEREELLKVFSNMDLFKEHLVTELIETSKLTKQVFSLDDVCRLEHSGLSEVVVFYKDIERQTRRFIVPIDVANRFGTSGYAMVSMAETNAAKVRGVYIGTLQQVLFASTDMGEAPEYGGGMRVVTGRKFLRSASTIFYPGVLNSLAKTIGEDFWIIPSSIHEMLVVPRSIMGEEGIDETLGNMIREVNGEFVSEEDRLADIPYHYSIEDMLFESGEEFLRRMRATTPYYGCVQKSEEFLEFAEGHGFGCLDHKEVTRF